MKSFKALVLFFLFCVVLMVSGALFAQSEIYGSCGGKPGTLDRLFTNASKIREKCIDDVYAANKEKTRIEVEELARTYEKLGVELKKVAIKSSVGLVQCAPRAGEPARDLKLIKRCEEVVSSQNAITDRMNELTGWNDRGRPASHSKNINAEITAPCPSPEKLGDLRMAASFNRKLFLTWEECRKTMIDRF